MNKIPDTQRTLRVLINCKTYPAVSTKYTETVCTGGVDEDGNFVRLYPIPFRFLPTGERFRRWDIVELDAYRSTKDDRPESWHLVNGSEIRIVDSVKRKEDRWQWMSRTVFESTRKMEDLGLTNGCVKIEPLKFYFKKDHHTWSKSQEAVIRQGDLFATEEEMKAIGEQIPFQFRLKFRETTTGEEFDRKVLQWSYYVGYLRRRSEGLNEEDAMQAVVDIVSGRIFSPKNDVFGIFGTHKRFKHWMISALYDVPKEIAAQRSLI